MSNREKHDETETGEAQLNVKWPKKQSTRQRDELEKKYPVLVKSNILKMTNVMGRYLAGLK